MRRFLAISVTLSCAVAMAQERPPLFEGIGEHEFKVTTTSPEAQDYFNQGLVLSYGFNLKEAHRAFVYASMLDPECAMAYWGAAYTLGPYLNGRMSPSNNEKALTLAAQALAKLDNETEIEKGLVTALQKRYEADVKRADADKNYANAMRELAKQFPQHPEVLTLTAESLMDLHPWNYWTREKTPLEWTKEITDMLDRSFAINPKHPGTCHFIIHMWEASATPEHAMPAADMLGGLAPGVEHLVHMPAHIYFKTGRYHEGTELNIKATAAYELYEKQCGEMGLKPVGGYERHDREYVWAGAVYEGRSTLALSTAEGLSGGHSDNKLVYTQLRFGHWDELLATTMPDDARDSYKIALHYGLAIAQLRRNIDVNAAQKEYDALLVLVGESPRSKHFQITRDIVAGEIAAAKGDWDAAIKLVSTARDVEDTLNDPELPSWHQPVRLVLGKVQMDAGRASDAEATYRECLTQFPNLGWALFGLMQSLEAQGKDASIVRAEFEKSWSYADIVLGSSRF